MRAKHVIDKEWDLKKFITFVRETYRISWKEIYWKVWSYLYIFRCNRCLDFFPLAEMGNCKYHSLPAKSKTSFADPASSHLEYECCKQQLSIRKLVDGSCQLDNGCLL